MRNYPFNHALVLRFTVVLHWSFYPPQIENLRQRIAKETAAAEAVVEQTGEVNQEHVRKIVGMWQELIRLRSLWKEGRLGGTNQG